MTGYAVSLPGMTHWDGQQVWYGGQTLDGQLSLAALRRRWQAGRPGTPPGPEAFADADTRDIFGYATAVAAEAARQLRASPAAAQSADIAWAAADVLTAAAQATGSPELQQAADGFSRAARASWGRIPPPSPGGAALRTAAYLLAACIPDRSRRTIDPPGADQRARRAGASSRRVARDSAEPLLQASAARSAAACLTRRGQQRPGDSAPARHARLPGAQRPHLGPRPRPAAPAGPGGLALRTVGPGPGRPRPARGRPGDSPGPGCGPGGFRQCHGIPSRRTGGGPPSRATGRTHVELSDGPIRDPLTQQAAAAEHTGVRRHNCRGARTPPGWLA